MKTMKKVVNVLLTLAMIASMASVVFALPAEFKNIDPPDTTGTLGNATSRILGFIQFIGYGIAVGMLLYIGIKYMMSSAADKADLKKGSINYVIGAILVAGATAVVTMLMNFGEHIDGSNG